jgi:hypothetical protein
MKKSIFVSLIVFPVILLILLLYISIVYENDNLRLLATSIIGFPISIIVLRLFKKYEWLIKECNC